jgi:two-component sensor histidine kinase/CheY-like chemotaxis protein
MDDSPNILVVDDDRQNRNVLQAMLESFGYRATLASTGPEALSLITSEIDLLLLDVRMPLMDGYEVARRIREDPEFFDLPIIMVTILDNKADRLQAVESGANDFISKPIDRLELQVRVASLLKMKQAQDKIKASLREKDVLLREIHHRVKNNLAIVSSLLRLQSRFAADEFHRQMFLDTQNRIRSMALVHEKLYQADNMAGLKVNQYVASLVDDFVASSRTLGRPITVQLYVEEISLGIETVVPLGIILTELISNCFRHAFPDGRTGEIRIELGPSEHKAFRLLVTDNGVGIPECVEDSDPPPFGLDLIRIFSQQLKGTMRFTRKQGTEFELEFCEIKPAGVT